MAKTNSELLLEIALTPLPPPSGAQHFCRDEFTQILKNTLVLAERAGLSRDSFSAINLLALFRVSAFLLGQLEQQVKSLPSPRSQVLLHQMVDLWGRQLSAKALIEKWASTHPKGWASEQEGTLFSLLNTLLLDCLKIAPTLQMTAAVTSIIEWSGELIPIARRNEYRLASLQAVNC